MAGALKDFEGAPCVDRKIQNAMKHASMSNFISGDEKSCRGIVAHFRMYGKVMENDLLSIVLILTVFLNHFVSFFAGH